MGDELGERVLRQCVGFFPVRELWRVDGERAREFRHKPVAGLVARLVAIKEQGEQPHAPFLEQAHLFGGHRPTHEADHRHAKGVKPEDRPEPLDEHQVRRARFDPVKVVEHPGFFELGRQLVLAFALGPSGAVSGCIAGYLRALKLA